MKFSTYRDALRYLFRTTDYERMSHIPYDRSHFGIERMKELARRVGSPEKSLRIAHIGGTKGKGSTAYILERLLRAHGLRTGLYISPHLIDLRERMQINGVEISRRSFCSILNRILPFREAMATEGEAWRTTFFETVTAMALLWFARRKIDIAVMEVGLGGRLDATNIVEPTVVGISVIDFDHTEQLGKSLTRIASEKAGIIKKGVPVILSRQPLEARRVIETVARGKGSPVVSVGRQIRIAESGDGSFSLITPKRSYHSLRLSLLGRHQKMNCALAIGMLEALEERDVLNVEPEKVKAALLDVECPGRLELLKKKPRLVIDGAHNPVSARALRKTLEEEIACERLILLLGIAGDKDVEGFLRQILPLADEVVATEISSPRGLKAEILARKARRFFSGNIFVEPLLPKALKKALSIAGAGDLILATGSFYLAGDVKKAFRRRRRDSRKSPRVKK